LPPGIVPGHTMPMFPRISLARIGQTLSSPLPRMLLLSLALHLALVMLIQPRPGRALPNTQLISARIVSAAPPQMDAEPAPDEIVTDDLLTARDQPAPVDAVAVKPPEPATPTAAMPEAPVKSPPTTQAADPDINPSRLPAQAVPNVLPSVPVMLDTTWYSARQLDIQPKAQHSIDPDYPEAARLDGTEGAVTLLLRINELGEVKAVTVESGNPPGVFEASAKAAFETARFIPARLAGRPVRAEIRIRVTYRLNE
jgi:protein TonB